MSNVECRMSNGRSVPFGGTLQRVWHGLPARDSAGWKPAPHITRSKRALDVAALFVMLACALPCVAQDADAPPRATNKPVPSAATAPAPANAASPQAQSESPPPSLNAPPATVVRDANRMMNTGEIARALEQYRRVLDEHPDERAVLFNSGLANFQLGDYAAARDDFERASLSDDPKLSTDAMYGMAACDYAEALSLRQSDAKAGLKKTERALTGLHDVLLADPKHEGANDARLKASSLWNQIKQIIEQQPPQDQQQDDQNESDEEDESDQQQQEQQQQQSDQDQDQQQDQQSQEQQQQDQQQQDESEQEQQQAAEEQEQQESEQQQQQERQQAEESEEEQAAAAEEREDEEQTREEALRQLRRLMDRQRLNQERRRELTPPAPLPRVEKDW